MLELLESLIRDYGYLALFVGTFLEGETILLIAGFLAHNGQLDLATCILVAFGGSLAGDQAAFYIGRWKGKQFVAKRPALHCRVERVHQMLDRFHEVLILTFRFFYGLRNLTPFILGTTDINPFKFFVLNAIGAAVWAVIFAYAGYVFGFIFVDALLNNVKHVEMIILLAAAVVFAVVWMLKRRRRKKAEALLQAQQEETEKPGEDNDNCES